MECHKKRMERCGRAWPAESMPIRDHAPIDSLPIAAFPLNGLGRFPDLRVLRLGRSRSRRGSEAVALVSGRTRRDGAGIVVFLVKSGWDGEGRLPGGGGTGGRTGCRIWSG